MLPLNWLEGWPNVWLGVTVENADVASTRIPLLRGVPAARRFLSCEPLLEYIVPFGYITSWLDGIDLVIVGGESAPGGKYRTMAWEWADQLRVQCEIEKVSFFMKQMSGSTKAMLEDIPGFLQVREFPEYTEVRYEKT
jgi:protein gp37